MAQGFKNLVVFPFKAELLGAAQHLTKASFDPELVCLQSRSQRGIFLMEFPEHQLLWGVCGHGKAQAAMVSEHLVSENPGLETLVCAGSGGALGPDMLPGQLVLGTKTIEFDFYEKARGQSHKPAFKSGSFVLDRSHDFSHSGVKVYQGPIASGDEDIVEGQRKKSLHKETGALAVGWEGAGVARVARWHKLAFCEIRAITDLADNQVLDEFQVNFPVAMESLGKILEFMFLTRKIKSE